MVTALVQSVLMPFIAGLVGSPNFDSFAVVTLNGNDIKFGVLLTAIVNFLLIAAAIYFVVVVPMNHMIERRNRRWASTRTSRTKRPRTRRSPCSPRSVTPCADRTR